MTPPSRPEAGAPPTPRPAREADDESVIALWRVCGLVVPWNDPGADIARCRASPQAELLVAELGGRVVATAMAGDDGHRGWLYYLAVDPALRGTGLGRAIVRHAEAWLEARGVTKVEVLIRGGNAGVQPFYEGLGYAAKDRIVMDRWFVAPPARDTG